MFEPPIPEPAAPKLTAEQRADLDCLGLGLSMADWAKARGEVGKEPPLVRIYLRRLRKTDPTRDWRSIAVRPPASITYGVFVGRMNMCQTNAEPKPSTRHVE